MMPSTSQGKAWWQKCVAPGHMPSTLRMDTVLSSHSPCYLDQDLGTWKNAAHIQSMSPHLNLSGNTLISTLRSILP